LTRVTWFLVVGGLALRLFFIFPGPFESKIDFFSNKADLRNYYWPAQTALRGENPYILWSSGQSGEFRADMAPLELLTFVATVAVWNDIRAIQILFALFDAINIALLGVLLKRSHLKLPFQLYYAFGPLTLYNLTLVPEDKTILLTLTFMIIYLLGQPKDRIFEFRFSRLVVSCSLPTLVIFFAALVGSFKWLSAFYLVPLLLFVSRDVRDFVKQSVIFVTVLLVAHLPWIPTWLYTYQFRTARTATPMHTAPAVLLNVIGLFDKNVLIIVMGLSLGLVYLLFWRKRIDIIETMALATAVGILWTPDMDPVHLSIIVISFLFVVDWTSRPRLLAVWALGLFVAAVYALSTRVGFARYGLPDVRAIIGVYGSPQMILFSYALFVFVFGFYLWDKWQGRPVGLQVILSGRDK
jgi:hypothetical protein